jgi:DNA modification methylase
MATIKTLEWNRIYRMDAIVGLRQLPDESVHLVVTDPPYNIAAKNKITLRNGQPISTAEAWGCWDQLHPFDYDVLIMQVISECFRVLKPGGGLYMFTAREQNGFFIRQAVARGFIYRNQIAMVKKNPLPSLSKSNWRSGFDVCMYLTKSKPRHFNFISQQACRNVLFYSNTERDTKHPTEKPLSVIRRLVEVSSQPDDRVLDPFMGSGTTAVACAELGREFLGFELEREYIKMAKKRLKGTKPAATLAAA